MQRDARAESSHEPTETRLRELQPMVEAGFRSQILAAATMFSLLVLGSIVMVIFLVRRDVLEDMADSLARRTESRGYQLVSTVEEIILTAPSRRLPELLEQGSELTEDLHAVYGGDPTFLYCVIVDSAGTIVFEDDRYGMLSTGPGPAEVDAAGFSEPTSRDREAEIDGNVGPYHEVTIPVVIEDQYWGALILAISASELSEQVEKITAAVIRSNVLLSVLVVVIAAAAAILASQLVRRARLIESELQRVDRLVFVGTLASGLAHELRNPLNAISLDSEMLAEDLAACTDQPDVRELAERIGGAVSWLI